MYSSAKHSRDTRRIVASLLAIVASGIAIAVMINGQHLHDKLLLLSIGVLYTGAAAIDLYSARHLLSGRGYWFGGTMLFVGLAFGIIAAVV